MTSVIIIGHGGYGTALKRTLNMILGDLKEYRFIDFNEQDDLTVLKTRITDAVMSVGGNDVLFCCDLAGGTPFREASAICTRHPGFFCVVGINIAAYIEVSFHLELSAEALADVAVKTAKSSVISFPALSDQISFPT